MPWLTAARSPARRPSYSAVLFVNVGPGSGRAQVHSALLVGFVKIAPAPARALFRDFLKAPSKCRVQGGVSGYGWLQGSEVGL
jgi:hypothetical protein